MTNSPVRAVLFDLWETLIHDPPHLSQPRQRQRAGFVQGVVRAHGVDIDADVTLTALEAAAAALTLLHDTGRDLDSRGRVDLFLAQLDDGLRESIPDAAMPAIEEAITVMPAANVPLLAPHAVETLATLKRLGLRTALISNAGFTTAPSLRWMLDLYGLRAHLDVLVFSDELCLAKPEPRIFAHALEALGCAPEACAFVGDSPHNDVFGAQAASIFAVQIGAKTRDGVTPDARIDALDQLLPALQRSRLIAGAAGPS